MAASSSSSGAPQAATNIWLSIRPKAGNPFNGLDWDPEIRDHTEKSYSNWSRLYWMFIPSTVFRKGADNMRYLNDDPAHKGAATMLYELFMIFCAMFGISAIHNGNTKDGALSFARHIATVTVVRSKSNPDEKAGFLFNCSYASHGTEDEAKGGQELRMKFEPCSMLCSHLDRSDEAKVAEATGFYSNGKPFQRSGGGGGNKEKTGECEQNRYFRELTREKWRKLADYYMGSESTGIKGHSENSKTSAYNPRILWSFANAKTQALASDCDPSFFEREQWKSFNRHSGTQYPYSGEYTYRFSPHEYAPRYMSVAMFPHIKAPLPSNDDLKFRQVLRVYYNGPIPEPGTTLDNPDEQNKYLSAVEEAQFFMVQTENDISIDDGSIDIHAAICSVEHENILKKSAAALDAAITEAKGILPNHILQEHVQKLRTELDAWENTKIGQWKMRFTAHNSKSSDAECAMAKYMNEYLSANRVGGFCMPWTQRYQHLSEFGNIMASNLLHQEFVNKSYVSHRAMIITQNSILTTWLGGLDEELRMHCLQTGEAAAGKSLVLSTAQDLAIDGTCRTVNGTSAKSEMVENNKGLHKMVILGHEAAPDKWGIGAGNGKGMRGQMTASSMANNPVAAAHRDHLTTGVMTYSTQETNTKTGVRYNKVITIKAQTTHCVNTNSHKTEIAENTIDRVEVIEYDSEACRGDISMAFVAATEKTPQAEAMKKLLVAMFRRNQCMIAVISTWINCRILNRIDTTATDMLFMNIQTSMSAAGLKSASNNKRAARRLKLLVKVLCMLHAIYVVLDSPLRIIDDTKPWTDASWEKLKDIRYHLVTKPEHLIFGWTLLKSSWQAAGVPEFVNAIIKHYALDIGTFTGDSPAMMKERARAQAIEDKRQHQAKQKKQPSVRAVEKKYKELMETEFTSRRQASTQEEYDREQAMLQNEYENSHAQEQVTGHQEQKAPVAVAKVVPVGYKYVSQTTLLRHLSIEEIEEKKLEDPENRDRSGWITHENQEQDFYYFSWLIKGASNNDKFNNNKGSLTSGASEDGISAGWIEMLASFALKIEGKVGVNPRLMRSAVMEMMTTTTDINAVRGGDKKEVKSLLWFEDKSKGDWYVRIAKSFMNCQKNDVVVETIKGITSSYGLKQETYVLGVQDVNVHYVWETHTPKGKRVPLQMTNPHYESKTALDIGKYLLPGSSGIGKYQYPDIRAFMTTQLRKLRNITFSHGDDAFLPGIAMFNLFRIGVSPGSFGCESYQGHSLQAHIGDPEHWERDMNGVKTPEGYREALYGPGNVVLYDNTENVEDAAKATSLLFNNARAMWGNQSKNVMIDMKNAVIIDPVHVTARLSLAEELEKDSPSPPSPLPLPPPPPRDNIEHKYGDQVNAGSKWSFANGPRYQDVGGNRGTKRRENSNNERVVRRRVEEAEEEDDTVNIPRF